MVFTTPTADAMKIVETGDGTKTLYSERYQQTYHSHFGALTEARWVYLEASGIAARLRSGQSSRVMEIGFGAGLNCLLTADLALQHGADMHYIAWEHDLPSPQHIGQLQYEKLLQHPQLSSALLQYLAGARHSSELNAETGKPESLVLNHKPELSLQLHQQQAVSGVRAEVIAQQNAKRAPQIDAIYLDAFSPDTNPECWTPEFLADLYGLLVDGGVVATYSVKGSVQRALKQVGFSVVRHPGPPGKREILSATK